jgi:GT2 family glycosyltransferase
MKSNILIVVPTQLSIEQYKETVSYKSIKKLMENNEKGKYSIDLDIHSKNKTGLSKLYNQLLKWEEPTTNIIVFLHDDVEIHDLWFAEKLIKAHEQYDIVGLAGATTQDYTKRPLVWHLCQKNHPYDSRGFVSHYIPKGFNNVQESHYNSSYFGPTPSEVAVIDGLFMSVKTESLKTLKEELFDNDMDFHHYDLSMCSRAKRNGLKIGVWPIFVIHHGLGEFENQAEWHRTAKIFEKRYAN